ncbi:MAG TPA: hypothetical protein P5267_03715, partial [Patescibacteria group bacterium]|nr:hypothetical protein [Patescibacteria group bacterium]
SQAEEMFASIGGLHVDRGLNTFLFGRHDHLSFEVVAMEGKINFFVVAPDYLKRFISQQIHAQYPYAQVEEVVDYNIFQPQSFVAGAYLELGRSAMFPLKTFRKMDSDPLDGITNSLSKLGASDGAAIQITARSAQKSWRSAGLKVVREMQRGKTMSEALRSSGATSTLGRVGGSLWNISKEFAVAGASGKTKEQKEREEQNKGLSTPHKLSALEEETAKGIEEKASKAGLDVNIKIVISAANRESADSYLNDILNSFSQYNIYEYGNKFVISRQRSVDRLMYDFIYRNFEPKKKIILNTEEMASLFHFPLPTCETPNINWLHSRNAPPPVEMPQTGLILGKNIYRGEEKVVRIKEADRRRHVYIIGMTGVGKTALVKRLAELLNLDDLLYRFDMGDSSSSWSVRRTLCDVLSKDNEKKLMIIFDEFQNASTIDNKGESVEKPLTRLVWELLDSGTFNDFRSGFYTFDKIQKLKLILESLLRKGVTVKNGVVTGGKMLFLDYLNIKGSEEILCNGKWMPRKESKGYLQFVQHEYFDSIIEAAWPRFKTDYDLRSFILTLN